MRFLIPLKVCPVAPGQAQQYVDQITGNVLWGVQWIFVVALVTVSYTHLDVYKRQARGRAISPRSSRARTCPG